MKDFSQTDVKREQVVEDYNPFRNTKLAKVKKIQPEKQAVRSVKKSAEPNKLYETMRP